MSPANPACETVVAVKVRPTVLLGCVAVKSGRRVLIFRRNLLPCIHRRHRWRQPGLPKMLVSV